MGYGNPIVAADPHPGPPIWSPGLSIFHESLIRNTIILKNRPVWTCEPFISVEYLHKYLGIARDTGPLRVLLF